MLDNIGTLSVVTKFWNYYFIAIHKKCCQPKKKIIGSVWHQVHFGKFVWNRINENFDIVCLCSNQPIMHSIERSEDQSESGSVNSIKHEGKYVNVVRIFVAHKDTLDTAKENVISW